MGNGRSIFGSPMPCGKCRKNEWGDAVWKIEYENSMLDDFPQSYNATLLIADETGFVKHFEKFNYATQKTNEILDIVGVVPVSSSGDKITMRQYLCKDCHEIISKNIDKLPEEWGYEAYYDAKGYELILLP